MGDLSEAQLHIAEDNGRPRSVRDDGVPAAVAGALATATAHLSQAADAIISRKDKDTYCLETRARRNDPIWNQESPSPDARGEPDSRADLGHSRAGGGQSLDPAARFHRAQAAGAGVDTSNSPPHRAKCAIRGRNRTCPVSALEELPWL